MATITRGSSDEFVQRIKTALDAYEQNHPGARASLYRQNSGSIRLRIIDDRFADWSKGKRHDYAWKFIADRLSDDDAEEISMLLLLASGEPASSFLNSEFDDPVPSNL